MRYTGSLNTVVWILTETHQRAMFHLHSLGIREVGIPVHDRGRSQRAVVISGREWDRQIMGRQWVDGDWILADAEDKDLDKKLMRLHIQGSPKHPPLRWL